MTDLQLNDCSFIRFQRVFLAIVGLLYISRGLQVWFAPEEVVPSWALLHQMLPSKLRVFIWMSTGFISLITGVMGKTPYGFFFITIMPAERMMSYAWSFVMYLIPGLPEGDFGSLTWFLWWMFFLFVLVLVSAWPDMNRRYTERKAVHHATHP